MCGSHSVSLRVLVLAERATSLFTTLSRRDKTLRTSVCSTCSGAHLLGRQAACTAFDSP